MHQNAPLPDKKKIKKFLEMGHGPLLRPLPYCGGGYPLPRPHLDSAFPFLFIYDSDTELVLLTYAIMLKT